MAADNNDTPDAVVLHVGTNDLTIHKRKSSTAQQNSKATCPAGSTIETKV